MHKVWLNSHSLTCMRGTVYVAACVLYPFNCMWPNCLNTHIYYLLMYSLPQKTYIALKYALPSKRQACITSSEMQHIYVKSPTSFSFHLKESQWFGTKEILAFFFFILLYTLLKLVCCNGLCAWSGVCYLHATSESEWLQAISWVCVSSTAQVRLSGCQKCLY